jgi:hypothetical protein
MIEIKRMRRMNKPFLSVSFDGVLKGWIVKRGKRWLSQPSTRSSAWCMNANSLRSAMDWLIS